MLKRICVGVALALIGLTVSMLLWTLALTAVAGQTGTDSAGSTAAGEQTLRRDQSEGPEQETGTMIQTDRTCDRNGETQEIGAAVLSACVEYDVPVDLAEAVIAVESGGQADAVNGRCIGLMQINTEYADVYRDGAGVQDLTDAGQNVRAGIWMIARLLGEYGDADRALMAYNLGESAAAELWDQGITQTDYTERIREARHE